MFILIANLVVIPNYLAAQSGVNSVNVSTNITTVGGSNSLTLLSHSASVNGVIPNQNYTLNYQNISNVSVVDFTLAGKNFVNYTKFDTVIIRRIDNPAINSNGNKQHIYCDGPATLNNTTYQVNFPIAYPASTTQNFMERVMKEGYINRGSDNVFNNDPSSDLTFTNIERMDFVYKNGLASSDVTKAGFLITERGGNDPFKIAAITAVDVNGNPTAFGTPKAIAASAYGNAIINISSYVMRKEIGDAQLRLFSKVPAQDVKGVFITFGDLGITTLQKVYGYALMANDVTATTGAQLIDFTNATFFPRNTNNANGGMDLASAPGAFHTGLILANNPVTLKYQKVQCDINLQLEYENWNTIKEYRIQKSNDATHFETIAVLNTYTKAQNYTIAGATGYYRMELVDVDGSIKYSSVINYKSTCKPIQVSVYPNPVINKLNIVTGNENKVSKITLQSLSGTQLGKWEFRTAVASTQIDLEKLATGTYMLVITDENGSLQTQKILKK